MILKIVIIAFMTQQVFSHRFIRQEPEPCPETSFINRTNIEWHGNIMLTSPSDVTGVQVELTFDQPIIGLLNNFAHSTSNDNRVFTISEQNKSLKRGEKLLINFHALFPPNFRIPMVTELKLNNAQVCPQEHPAISDNEFYNNEAGCAKFEMDGDGAGGRWDGVLTIYPRYPRNGIRVDVEFDQPVWAFGNDLGDTRTFDQKRFIVIGRQPVRPGYRLPIKLFVKYDELEGIPKLKTVYIDGMPICVTGSTNKPAGIETFSDFSTEPAKPSGIRLQDLPFDKFPSVTLLPPQVNNNNFECGLSSNALRSRFTGGTEAESGQFPFHTAVFRDLYYICGGSLVSPKAVVSAAHCVVNDQKQVLNKESFRLLFGAIDLKSLSGTEALREVLELIPHPDYEHDMILKQDIALIIIKGNLQLTPTIRPLCLFDSQTPISNHIDERFTVLGFGSSENSREPSRYLNYGQMSIISRKQCIESKLLFGLLPEQSAFCAKSVENMVACPGDSGGGLIFTISSKFYLRGLSSVTVTESNVKCDPKQAVAFTDVSYFLPWIRQTLEFRYV